MKYERKAVCELETTGLRGDAVHELQWKDIFDYLPVTLVDYRLLTAHNKSVHFN